jgi:hypothetical protein
MNENQNGSTYSELENFIGISLLAWALFRKLYFLRAYLESVSERVAMCLKETVRCSG